MAAGDRTKKIISHVRLRLDAINVGKGEDEEIFDFGNEIQIDMMVRLRCVEYPKTISLTNGTASYTLDNYQGRVKGIIPSWEAGEIAYIDNAKWKDYKDADASYPLYGTIFGNKLYLAPAPSESGLKIDLWIHQKMYTEAMSKSTDPETPEFLDLVLETGILSIYAPDKYLEQYERMLRAYSPVTHQKQNVSYKVEGDWLEE